MYLDDVYSANEQVGKSIEERSREGEDDDDWVAESAKVVERNDRMATGDMTNGPLNRIEVEQDVHERSETVVATSSGIVGQELETTVGEPNYGCAKQCQNGNDQVCTPGFMKSLTKWVKSPNK
ncbi:hypothetical protein CsSME_00015963 [Camellia sinensis var. sinensis]